MARLPDPRLRDIDDQTGLTVMQYDKMAPGLLFCDVVVVKARFSLTPQGLQRQPQPAPLRLADTHREASNPLGSSLAYAGDLILTKPGADILVEGQARHSKPSRRWAVGVKVYLPQQVSTPLAHYQGTVSGPRVWQHSLFKGWQMSEAQETQAVPIAYELAYGGSKADPDKDPNEWSRFEANPSGSGYSFAHCSVLDTPSAPQWGAPVGAFSALNAQDVYGLGPMARFWSSRKRYAGSYNAAWRKRLQDNLNNPEFIPDYADDFDLRYFQCAHPKLQTAKPLMGNEHLLVDGLLAWQPPTSQGETLKLPGLAVAASFTRPGRKTEESVRLPLDTVTLNTDEQHVDLVWRLSILQSHGIERVRLELGEL